MDNKFDVFISYSHVDAEFAGLLRSALADRGIRVWLDAEQIRPGDWWAQALETALASVPNIAILISSHSLSSGWVNEEYYRALAFCHQTGLRLIPVLMEDSELPNFLGTREYVDFRYPQGFQSGVDRLVWGISGERGVPGTKSAISTSREYVTVTRDSFEVICNYAVQYAEWFLCSLRQPSTMATMAYKWTLPINRVKLRIIGFLLVSVLIASSISAVTPNREPMIDRASVVAILAVMAVFAGLVVHCFCIVFGGTGEPGRTIFSVMQVLALVYVLSSFLSLLTSSGLLLYSHAHSNAQLPSGSDIILIFQFALLLIYLPLTLKAAHGFTRYAGAPKNPRSSTHRRLAAAVVASSILLACLTLLATCFIVFLAWLIGHAGGC